MAEHHGNAGTALVLQPGYPIKQRQSDGTWQVTYLYWCAKSSAYGLAPAYGAGIPSPESSDHSGLVAYEIEIRPHEIPERVLMRVVYRDPTSVITPDTPAENDEIKESEATLREEYVDRVTNGSSADADTAKDNKEILVPIASVRYSRTLYKSSFTWSEAEIVKCIGGLQDPVGLSSPTANAWLKVGRTVRQTGDLYEIRDTWEYDSLGWNADRPNTYATCTTTT